MKNFCRIVCMICSWLLCDPASAQLQVDGTLTPLQLVDSVLLGPGVVAFNVSFTGNPAAIGFFDGRNSNIGLDSGIIISTGRIIDAPGPNNSTFCSTINQSPGDSTLTAIAGQPTLDAAILEFDFIPSSDTVEFRYVFASEEYYEGVCTPFNDVFAFLISGPSIAGVVNIATLPNTGVPVSISSVNEGYIGLPGYGADSTFPWCYLTNTSFYVDNSSPPGMSVEFDGFTVVLTARAGVIPCQVYHIRMAIADGGSDNTWDSGVFLEAGSFNSRVITITAEPLISGASIDSAGAEGCSVIDMVFRRYDSIAYPRTLAYTLSGTAIAGTDYSVSSAAINFLPGEDTFHLYVTPFYDGLAEGLENVMVTLIPDFIVCFGWDTASVTGYINDQPPLTVTVAENFIGCPFDSIELVATASGGAFGNYYSYAWTPATSGANAASFWIPSGSPSVYTVTVTDSCGQQSAAATYTITDLCLMDVPNIITPNGDGANDYFTLPAEYLASGTALQIYNRWGNSIYSVSRYDNSWNATGVSDGTYYYLITTAGGNMYNGFFMVIRQ